MNDAFTIRRQVEFNHCDPAGIVFYPRYFEMISSATERFFSDALDFSWAGMGLADGFGTPMGNIETRFYAPSRLEDWLTISITAKRVGTSSLTLQIDCHCEDERRFACKATLVHANIQTGTSHPWPDAPRAAMTRYLLSVNSNQEDLS